MESNIPPINQRDTLPVGYDLLWYKLLAVIGRGGYGITYLALDQNLDRRVAIKEYLPIDFAHRDANDTVHPMTHGHKDLFDWGLKRFLVEARTLAKFNHPGIIRVLSVFEHNQTAYMVMDYEKGDDLAAAYKKRGSFTEQELLNIFVPVVEGLADVHKSGFIHRDVKPSNIYIRTDGSSVLLDFGSARQTLETRTRALTTLVTSGYAPFEQYNESEEEQGPWTDIYGLGASMYYCITGKKPLDALERGSGLLKIGKDGYEPLDTAQYPGFSAGFLHAINQALLFQPEGRPQNAHEWVDMLTGKVDPTLSSKSSTQTIVPEDFFQDDRTVIRRAPTQNNPVNSRVESATKTSTANPAHNAPTSSAKSEQGIKSGAFTSAENTRTNQAGADMTPADVDATLLKTLIRNPAGHKTGEQVLTHSQQIYIKPIYSKEEFLKTILPVIRTIQKYKIASSIAASMLVLAFIVAMYTTPNEEQPTPIKIAVEEKPVERTPAQKVAVAKQELVAGLLVQAQSDIANERFFEPPENNAVSRFKKILAIQPDQVAAINGLKNVANHYLEKIESHIGAGDWKLAKQELEPLIQLPIQIDELQQVQDRFAQHEKQQELINSLLTKAENLLDNNRLTKPDNASALYYFNLVLKDDSDNQRAKDGLNKIVKTLSIVLNKQIEKNDIKKAESTFNLIESINPDAEILSSAESRFGEINKQRKEIRLLLASADKDFIRGRVIKPSRDNALYKYRKVLKLSPNNKKALDGIEVIYNYFVSSLIQFASEEKYDKAAEVAETLKSYGYEKNRIAELYITIEKEKLAIKNEQETIQNILAQLKAGIQQRDMQIINKISIFENKKQGFIDSVFDDYRFISVNVQQQSHDRGKHQAEAIIKLKGQTKDGAEFYTKEGKLDIDILVRKEKNKQWKVVW